jgi:hypothetical protein
MAKIITTAIVADIRNKLNGSVFSKNRYGSYVRTKVSPVNPQTTAQQAVRQRLGNNSSAWRGLTDAQRLSWINAAPNFPFTDIFGNSQTLSGQALYVKLNNNIIMAGGSAMTTAPTPIGISSMVVTGLVSDVSSTTVTLTISVATVPVGFALAVFATPQITAGRNYVTNRYRYLGNFTATANDVTLYTAYVAKFGAIVAGMKVFVKAFLISTTTGQAGVPSSAVATVTA